MSKFDASFQIRAGLRARPTDTEGAAPPVVPTVEEVADGVKAALEARWPDFEARVGAERLDRD